MEDRIKHECIQLLLGRHPNQSVFGFNAQIQRQLQSFEKVYIKEEEIILEVFTWNCAGEAPHAGLNITEIIFPHDAPNAR